MTFIYHLGISLFKLGVTISALFNSKTKLLSEGQKMWAERLRTATNGRTGYIWIHAASLGEFEQGRPLIEYLKKKNPETKILVTFFSPSGYEVRKDYDMADVVCYLPFDTAKNANLFVDIIKPSVAIFVKYEFWYNYLKALKTAGIPTYSVSAIFRSNQLFFKSYGGWYRKMLANFNYIFVQDNASAELLKSIGVTNCEVAGDTRFDRVRASLDEVPELDIVASFCGDSQVLVVGSSWPKDEDLLCQYINATPNLKVIIAPHEVHVAHIDSIVDKLSTTVIRYTEATATNVFDKQVLIVNTIGVLSAIYRYATITYIGGGFGVGIHNILEAATFGKPVVFGPNHKKFKEAVDLVEKGGAVVISNYSDLKLVLDKMTSDSNYVIDTGAKSLNYVSQNLGATKLIMSHIETVL